MIVINNTWLLFPFIHNKLSTNMLYWLKEVGTNSSKKNKGFFYEKGKKYVITKASK